MLYNLKHSEEIVKAKTNSELGSICKDIGIAQYGDKATIIKRILDNGGEAPNTDKDKDAMATEDEGIDYFKLKKPELVDLLKKRKIGGFSNKLKADLIKKLIKHDEETARIAVEKEALGEDFGECEQCVDLPNIKAVVKAHFKCNDCDLKICGPCEIAHIKTKATRFHMIEPLLKISLVHRSIPQFAKPSAGGGNSSAPEEPKVLKMKMAEFGTAADPFVIKVNHGGVILSKPYR